MANRHLSRSIVLQTLFEWDFNGQKRDAQEILAQNVREFAPGVGDFSFMKKLLADVLKKRKTIDAVIEKAAPEWPLERISPIDRNVLRIGLYELLFGDRDEVPAKVAINEAIELAKTFGGENSGKFVNGVLGAVYRELGEPGVEEGGRRKERKEVLDLSKMLVEKLGGAVVYARKGGKIYLAFVHDIFGHWTLSKGKMEKDEDEKLATVREIKEEIGIDIDIKKRIAENEYIASDPERGKIRKQVTYFLAETPFQELQLGPSGGLDNAQWFTLEELPQLNMYDDIIPIVTKGVKMIAEKYK